jgi:hypothetical protein
MPKVLVDGFANVEDAQVFIDWYKGQGEQSCEYWGEEYSTGETDYYDLSMEVVDV